MILSQSKKLIQRIFFSRKGTVFLMMVAVLQRLLDTNTIHLDGVGLWTSSVSLKVVLLHNGNKFPSVPLAHAAEMKESC